MDDDIQFFKDKLINGDVDRFELLDFIEYVRSYGLTYEVFTIARQMYKDDMDQQETAGLLSMQAMSWDL
ncbi:hypothetical protein H5154_22280 [Pseudoalteromonas sp. SR44-5]|uniref:Uncharacterized protein n=1 Tax=Pseudoalteromonas rhizosphaerae TaxID=2518973 RepID=A0ABW8L5S9_9GAMM|nr:MULTISPECIES: hypothetical protein [unclassified Pseudoalteromonas]MBB1336016.1 hypothetical protein [Pseudoalteromonas sp. SR41-6]MBB1369065.1 hypothetical protein [Pseudoalteromonas sp. SR44-5]MBB1419152.1 hypothetical protein [Pseudoalteromonas sp. SG44-1]MBB1422622.1 hypothetical protein [Pseudoalteromonas sp. SG43-7]MBB1461582.1 hypothetical protein [Pseudoalteromonas sp. SG41-8]